MSIFDTKPLVRNPLPPPLAIEQFTCEVERELDNVGEDEHGQMTLTSYGVEHCDLDQLADTLAAEGYIVEVKPAPRLTRWLVCPSAHSFVIFY